MTVQQNQQAPAVPLLSGCVDSRGWMTVPVSQQGVGHLGKGHRALSSCWCSMISYVKMNAFAPWHTEDDGNLSVMFIWTKYCSCTHCKKSCLFYLLYYKQEWQHKSSYVQMSISVHNVLLNLGIDIVFVSVQRNY